MQFHSGIFKLVLSASLLLLVTCAAVAQDTGQFSNDKSPLPQATEPVNDFAGVLSPQTVSELNKKIKDFKARTNPPVVLAVAVVRTTGDRDIFDYSLAVARGWKIGTDKDDNPSALLFIAIDDRKYFTQVSRDLEDELPDGLVGRLQRKYLVPAFTQGDYDRGVRDTVDAYIATIEGKVETVDAPAPASGRQSDGSRDITLSDICYCIAVLLILFPLSIGRRRRGGVFFFGGGGGGGGSSWSSGGGGFGGFSGGDFGGGGSGGDW